MVDTLRTNVLQRPAIKFSIEEKGADIHASSPVPRNGAHHCEFRFRDCSLTGLAFDIHKCESIENDLLTLCACDMECRMNEQVSDTKFAIQHPSDKIFRHNVLGHCECKCLRKETLSNIPANFRPSNIIKPVLRRNHRIF